MRAHSGSIKILLAATLLLLSCSIASAQTGSFNPATNFAVKTHPWSIAVADFNGDGFLDLAVTNNSSNNVSILLGTGTGTFGAPTHYAVGTAPRTVAVGDLNGDGFLDLAVVNNGSNNVSILLGTGTGTFGAAKNFTVDLAPSSLVLGDFDGDGILDMVVTSYGNSNVSAFSGKGDGTFGLAKTLPARTVPFPWSSVAGDFNGDGFLDLAVTNQSSHSVTILLGDNTGHFGVPPKTFGVGTTPRSVALGDFNGDGKLDLAVANYGSNDVSILLGTGNGSFGPATSFPAGTHATAVAVGDFNGDGKLDLVVANYGSNNVSVLFGTGNGSFGAPTSFSAGTNPIGVAVGDFNGDGALDLAVANYGSNNVSVLLNKPDIQAPGAVTNLATGTVTDTSVPLSWTTPGNDGNIGTATVYDIRYALAPITEGTWAAATQVSGEPAPLPAGTLQTFTVNDLSCSTPYYFALKSSDGAHNISPISNSPTATTLACVFDIAPPNLAITSHTNNQTVTTSPVAISGTASDAGLGNHGILSVTVNGVAADNGSASGAGTANWSRSLTLNVGANLIIVAAKDNSTNQNLSTAQITLNYELPNQTPDSSITSPVSNATILAGQSVDFQGAGADPDGNLPLSYHWNFGGAAPDSSLPNPGSITFNNPGVYTVTFGVTDSLGLADPTPATRTITVVTPAAVVFVEPAGICGGHSHCFTSIQEAISVISSPGNVKVAQGTYHENILLVGDHNFTLEGGWNSSFSVRSNNPALTILDGDLTGDSIGEDAVLSLAASSGQNIQVAMDGFTLQNGNGAHGGAIFAIAATGGQIDLTVSENIIRNNQSTNNGAGVGVYAQDPSSQVQLNLTNNMIFANDAGGEGGGVFIFSDSSGKATATLINNTIADNAATGAGGGLRASSNGAGTTDVTVKNTILWGNMGASGHDIAIRQSSGGSATVHGSFNDVGDVVADAAAPGTYDNLGSNIDADPLFVNLTGGDLRLIASSPAIDIGTATGAPTVDFEGDTRPQALGYDIGADEHYFGPLAINAATLPSGEIGVDYNASLGITGGHDPYTISVSVGALPAGLGLSLDGRNIVGTPTAAGKKSFTIKVIDHLGATVSKKFTLTITKDVLISSKSMKAGTAGKSYSAILKASGGSKPYTWSVTSGILPSGLALDAGTGTVSGVAAAAGSTALTFQVSDAAGGSKQASFTLTIN